MAAWKETSKMIIRLFCLLVLVSSTAVAAAAPSLPEHDGEVLLPAQEWPWQPGPREIKAWLWYPEGALTGVTPDTGLMLTLHNWGGAGVTGAPDPVQLVKWYQVVAIGVDYLQSGPYDGETDPPYDFGCLQALDALRALHFVYSELKRLDKPFATGRMYATGGSGGGNVTLMANKFAPRTFACVIDLCGMAKLNDDIAFNLPEGSRLNAGYSRDPASPRYLPPHAQELRFIGFPAHLETMKKLGTTARVITVHGEEDDMCPVADKKEMAANMRAAGFEVDTHFIAAKDLDGEVLKSAGHSLGDRTRIVFRYADVYLEPGGPQACLRTAPNDFDLRDEQVTYAVTGGQYVISYTEGYPVIRFEASP
jgi:predicted esterase